MRANHYLPLALLLSMTFVSSAFAQSSIRWTNDLREAQHIAQRDGRLILIHFYSDTCGPCRILERDVFPRTDVAAAMMKNYVPVLIDAERFRDVAAHYQVEWLPTDVITDNSGRVVYRTKTPQDPIRYIQLLNGVAGDHRFATPGYAMASRDNGRNPSRFAGDTHQPAQPLGQDRQHQATPSIPSGGQRSLGHGYQYQGSVPPGPAPSATGRGYESGSVPNQPAHESGYGPRYAGQAPDATQPSMPIYTPPPTPRETHNPHIAPPNGMSPGDTRPQMRLYQDLDPRPSAGDYGTTYQPPAPNRQSGQQTGPSLYTGRGTQPGNSIAGQQPSVGPRPSMTDSRDPRFTSTPVAPQMQEWPLALDGFCPVTLEERGDTESATDAWQQGDPQWGARHRGRTYLFTSQRNQRMFLQDPDRYSPMLSGYDPVRYIEGGETVPGLRQHGLWFNSKMYLFADEPSLNRFKGSPDFFSQKAHNIMMQAGR